MSNQPPTEPRSTPTDHPPTNADAPTVPPAESTGPDPSASSAPTRMADDLAARLLDHPRYRMLRLLGRGGMGAVYLAEHLFMSRLVALKVVSAALMDSPAALERFPRRCGPRPSCRTPTSSLPSTPTTSATCTSW